jgi:TRAP-type C4-dicarboxylate transport system permease small subunit
MEHTMTHHIQRSIDGLYLACIWVAGLSIVGMSLIIPIGVFARYVLGFGAQWPEPIALLLMVIFTFIGSAAGYRAGAHIAVGMVTDRLPPRWHKAFAVLVDVLMISVSLFMLVYGFKLSMETMSQSLAAIPVIPVGLTYAPLPLGGLFTLIFVLEKIFLGSQRARAVVCFDHEVAEPTPGA